MGWFSGFVHAITHPTQAIKHLVHNPASAIVPKHVRNSSLYKNVARPAIKIGTGAAEGFLIGGPVGAAIGAGTEVLGGGLTNKPFRPLPNLVGPAAAAAAAPGLISNVLAGGGVAGAPSLASLGVPGALPAGGQFGGPLFGGAATPAGGGLLSGLFPDPIKLLSAGKNIVSTVSHLAGAQGNKKLMTAAQQAQNAALAGDAQAYQKAIDALNREIARLKSAAEQDVGSAGFVVNRGRGSFYNNIAAKLSADAQKRRQYLAQQKSNADARARAAAAANIAQAKSGMLSDLFGAGQSALGLLGNFIA